MSMGQLYTNAGKTFNDSLTAWLQDTRLMSEAAHRLAQNYRDQGKVGFSDASWPKPKKEDWTLQKFEIKPVPLATRMDTLLRRLWQSQFVFLESLWEEYLQELVLELRHKDASIFEPFCEQQFMALIVRDVLSGKLETIEEIKDEAAGMGAACSTRRWFGQGWKRPSVVSASRRLL
jgi:hypothetical protein